MNMVGAPSGWTSASTSRWSATSPTVTNHLTPSIRQPSPSGVAVVAMPLGSEPACSSVIATASRRSPRMPGSSQRARCSSVQARNGFAGRQTASHSAFVRRPSSSWTTTCSSTLRPAPPHSTGMLIAFRRASSTAARISASRSGVSEPSRSHSSSYAISVVVRPAARRLSSSSSGV